MHIGPSGERITEMPTVGQAVYIVLRLVAAVEGFDCMHTGVQSDFFHIVTHPERMSKHDAAADCIDFIKPLSARPIRCVRMIQQPLLVRPVDQAFIIRKLLFNSKEHLEAPADSFIQSFLIAAAVFVDLLRPWRIPIRHIACIAGEMVCYYNAVITLIHVEGNIFPGGRLPAEAAFIGVQVHLIDI